ncbi:hypothetical protein ACFQ3Z_44070 [Streptomyces nogalater]
MAALSMALLLPQQTAGAAVTEQPQATAATVDPPLADGEIQQVGPGLYSTAEKSFELYETDVAEGLMGRTHTVTEGADGVARPESAPATRPDQGVFGPGWEAGFLGDSSTASWSRRPTPSWSPTSTRRSPSRTL